MCVPTCILIVTLNVFQEAAFGRKNIIDFRKTSAVWPHSPENFQVIFIPPVGTGISLQDYFSEKKDNFLNRATSGKIFLEFNTT